MTDNIEPLDYQTLPLELFTITDLSDALGVPETAKLLETSRRAIYTIRNTNVLAFERQKKLIDAIRKDEANYRSKLVTIRSAQKTRALRRAD